MFSKKKIILTEKQALQRLECLELQVGELQSDLRNSEVDYGNSIINLNSIPQYVRWAKENILQKLHSNNLK